MSSAKLSSVVKLLALWILLWLSRHGAKACHARSDGQRLQLEA
jgi:hypothetical protein